MYVLDFQEMHEFKDELIEFFHCLLYWMSWFAEIGIITIEFSLNETKWTQKVCVRKNKINSAKKGYLQWGLNNKVFLKWNKVGNFGHKGYCRKEQINLTKKVTSSRGWTWTLRTPLVAHLVLHSHAFPTDNLVMYLVRLRLLGSTYSHALLISAKYPNFKSQLVHQQK